MKKKKSFRDKINFIAIFLLSLLLIPSNVGYASEEGPTYTIITGSDYAPFHFTDSDGNLIGIEIELLEAIANDQGFNFDYQIMPFSSGLQALEANQADGMIAAMGVTEERENSFDFSDPYFEVGSMYAVRGDSEIETMDDMHGATVATKIGSQGNQIAERMREDYDFTVVTFEDSVNMYQDLLAGNSDAVIEDYPVMAYAAQTGTIDMKLIGEELETLPLAFAVNKGENQELLELFNQGLSNVVASGEYEIIMDNYLGSEVAQVDTSFFGQLRDNLPAFMDGLGQTLLITILSLLIATVLGVILGLMTTMGGTLVGGIAKLYIDIMRGVPLIVLAFFIYFGIPQFTGWQFTTTVAGVLTLGLNAAAYMAEIVRGGIQSIAVGQSEAGRSLGLSRRTTMNKIVLPQAIRIMIPSFINQFVITLKDTSILSVIGLVELTQTGRIIIARTYQSGPIWLIVALFYIVIITILTKLSNYIESRLINQ